MMNFTNKSRANVPEADNTEEDLFNTAAGSAAEKDFAETPETAAEVVCETDSSTRTVHKVPMPRANTQFRRRSAKENSENDKLAASEALQEARKNAGMSLDTVADMTKIRVYYLSALEEGRFNELPQAVYVLAYLRRLCQIYGISAEEEEQLVSPWMDLQCDIPESLSSSLDPDRDNENRRILRRLEIGLLAGAAIVVIGLIVFAVILLSSMFGGRNKDDIVFDENVLLELQDKPVLRAPAANVAGVRYRQ